MVRIATSRLTTVDNLWTQDSSYDDFLVHED